jgi:uncharacterized protein YbjQ (UPF0145 family)
MIRHLITFSIICAMISSCAITSAHADESEMKFLSRAPAEETSYREVGTIEIEGLMPRREYKIELMKLAAEMGGNAIYGLEFATRVKDGSCIFESEPWATGTAIKLQQPIAANNESIKIIRKKNSGLKYVEMGEVKASGMETMRNYKQALREEAGKLSADAIINIKFGTDYTETSCITESVPYAESTAIFIRPTRKVAEKSE